MGELAGGEEWGEGGGEELALGSQPSLPSLPESCFFAPGHWVSVVAGLSPAHGHSSGSALK